MSTDDFRDLVEEFRNDPLTPGIDPLDVVNLSFLRWDGATKINGIVSSGNTFSPLIIGPEYAFVPTPSRRTLERFNVGDREKGVVLIWTFSRDLSGAVINTLRTIEQVGHDRADRIADDDRGLTYIVREQKDYGRQARVAGAIGILLDRG